jgi:hypothetical protein
MKKYLIGLSVLSGGFVIATALMQPAAAKADGGARNPAVQMAVTQGLESPLFAETPAFGSAFASVGDGYVLGLAIQEPPLRVSENFRTLGRPYADDLRNLDLELALGGRTGSGLELEVAPRAGLTVGPDGRTGAGAGAEVRIGKGLRSVVALDRPNRDDAGSWYLFAATDGSAITWRPNGEDTGLRGLRLQEERIVVGDVQIGVSSEFNGMQASLSFVNREISNGKESTDQNFVGATLTWRR